MGVMSVGKKPKVLVRPLRAGNSRAGAQPGQFCAGEPGTAASRPEKRNVPGVSLPARRDAARPSRPRAARKAPARPRLWVVPDEPGLAVPGDGAGTPASSGPASRGPVRTGPGAPGSRMPGDAPARPPLAGSGAPLVPRPRVAPDEQIPVRPGIHPPAPGRPRDTGPGAAPTRTRIIRRAAAPSRVPVRGARRTRLTRRGRRLLWASVVLLVAAVLTPVLLALASGAQAANHGVPPSAVRAGLRQVVVTPGQSLWSIALRAEPTADPRVVVQQIMDDNALGSQVVVPGESLWVPGG
jgi:LysM domain